MKPVVTIACVPALVMALLVGLTVTVSTANNDAAPPYACPSVGDTRCAAVPDIAAMPFTGPDVFVDDPTSSGRITTRTLHLLGEVELAFGTWPWGIHCWDPHPWNPTSDHPRGRACDYTIGRLGTYPNQADRATGWALAHWLQANADALGVSYLIWDAHIWSPARADEGWRPYNGAGIYDIGAPTGSHRDHVHTSVIPSGTY